MFNGKFYTFQNHFCSKTANIVWFNIFPNLNFSGRFYIYNGNITYHFINSMHEAAHVKGVEEN